MRIFSGVDRLMDRKIRLGLICGGQSAEHEVSLKSAQFIIENLDKNKYEILLIGIDRKGIWHFLHERDFSHALQKEEILPLPFLDKTSFLPSFRKQKENFSPSFLRKTIDVLFPALHGPNGEDGTVQGLARLANLPFVGCDVLSSAICMDKSITKRLLREGGFPTARFKVITANDSIHTKELLDAFALPLIVKPSNLGSSIGISKVHTAEELPKAMELAFNFDHKILIEEYIVGRELECSVLGNKEPMASLPGEVIPKEEFFTYEAKYLQQGGAVFKLPAPLDEVMTKKVQDLAIAVYKAFCCEGMARVDFFLKKEGSLLVNELNTIPGFTRNSRYAKLWKISGLSHGELLDKLITFAIERYESQKILKQFR